jgi:hypothetical protein
MRQGQRWGLSVLVIIMLLAANVGAGTKPKSPPPAEPSPTPKTPAEQFRAKVHELDPQGLLIISAKTQDRPSELWVAMTQRYYATHYQERLQLAQAMGGAWRTISGHPDGVVFLTDRMGNIVGSSFRSNTTVQRY